MILVVSFLSIVQGTEFHIGRYGAKHNSDITKVISILKTIQWLKNITRLIIHNNF